MEKLDELGFSEVVVGIEMGAKGSAPEAFQLDSTAISVAFDTVGGEVLSNLLRPLAPRGVLVSIGFVGGQRPTVDLADIVSSEKRIVGYSLHASSSEELAESLGDLLSDIGPDLRPVIDSDCSPERIDEAYARLDDRDLIGSVLLRFSANETDENERMSL
ncbi:MAG: zinc-binding dehydrogenase [Leucobacter sp.]